MILLYLAILLTIFGDTVLSDTTIFGDTTILGDTTTRIFGDTIFGDARNHIV